MKAMIFAAGLGTRLRPLTDHCPKALVPVAGRPMLEHVIQRLRNAGFNDLIINIHHQGEQIIEYLKKHPFPKTTIRISDERNILLDTGGGILKARPMLDGNEPFLIHNVDILSDIDLHAFYQQHLQTGAEASLLVSKRHTTRYLLFDEKYYLHGWTNKETGEVKPANINPATYLQLAFGGIHVFSPSLFKRMEMNKWQGRFSIIPFYLSICNKANIKGIKANDEDQWFDIGKPETLKQAERWLNRKNSLLKS